MSKPLEGRVALVAGATRGAGRGIAVALGEAGATVYAPAAARASGARRSTGRRRSRRPPSSVTAAGGEGIAVAVDHLEPEQVRALVARIDAEQGRLDVLVNDIWGAEHLFEWDTPMWEHDLDERPAAAAPRGRHAPHHEPLRAAAAAPPAAAGSSSRSPTAPREYNAEPLPASTRSTTSRRRRALRLAWAPGPGARASAAPPPSRSRRAGCARR